MKTPYKENTVKAAPLQSSPRKQRGRADQQSDSFADNRSQAQVQAHVRQMADTSAHGNEISQLKALADGKGPNRTGLPDNLKAGIENLSGYSMDDVKVHYNSDKPTALQALAYAQGTDIHIAPGQEQHLPHEAWHVVQQKQGRVRPTMQMKGEISINNDEKLETEADTWGAKATMHSPEVDEISNPNNSKQKTPVQLQSPSQSVTHVSVIQYGGSKWTPHSDRQLLEKIGESSGIALYYTKDAESFYVEGWRETDKKKWVYAGAVQLEPKGKFLAMHTRSEEGMEGGLGAVMMKMAIDVVVKHHTGFEFVQLTPAPGAASKKVIELLSQKVGDPDTHAEAENLRAIRIKDQKNAKSGQHSGDRDKRLQTWDPFILPEHLRHLESIVGSDQTDGIQITGPAGALVGFDESILASPADHVAAISANLEGASGYGIKIPMDKLLKIGGQL